MEGVRVSGGHLCHMAEAPTEPAGENPPLPDYIRTCLRQNLVIRYAHNNAGRRVRVSGGDLCGASHRSTDRRGSGEPLIIHYSFFIIHLISVYRATAR